MVDVDKVLEHCREQLADFKVPQYVCVASVALPRNAGGKLVGARAAAGVLRGLR